MFFLISNSINIISSASICNQCFFFISLPWLIDSFNFLSPCSTFCCTKGATGYSFVMRYSLANLPSKRSLLMINHCSLSVFPLLTSFKYYFVLKLLFGTYVRIYVVCTSFDLRWWFLVQVSMYVRVRRFKLMNSSFRLFFMFEKMDF